MTITFDRPLGTTADLKELEYISALHQTCMPKLRQDASIHAEDICNLLSSRHGLLVDVKLVKEKILLDLAGELDMNKPSYKMDLCQVVAILLIPHLLKLTEQQHDHHDEGNKNGTSSCGVIERVLAVLVSDDVNGSHCSLTRTFLRDVLEFHGEINVDDDTLDEMITVAGGDGTTFTTTCLLQALTSDVRHYHPFWSNRNSTHYQDVFSTSSIDDGEDNVAIVDMDQQNDEETTVSPPSDSMTTDKQRNVNNNKNNSTTTVQLPQLNSTLEEETIVTAIGHWMERRRRRQQQRRDGTDNNVREDVEEQRQSTTTSAVPVRKIYTASAIDNVADTYSSQSFTVLLWASMILVYLAYFFKFDLSWGTVNCETSNLTEFGCKVINGITSWLVIFVELSLFGTAYIFLGSAGNALHDNKCISIGRLVIGMATICTATLLSLVFVVDTPVVATAKDDRFLAAYIGAAFLGCLLLMIQLLSLVGQFFTLDTLKRHACLEAILSPGMEKMERHTKQAAVAKVSRMVDNALVFHNRATAGSSSSTSIATSEAFKMTARGTALLNFQMREERTERAGGVWWAWKRVWNGTIFDNEGIWLHSRLVSSTVTQVFICIFIVVFWAIVVYEILKQYGAEADTTETNDSSSSEPVVYVWEAVVAGFVGISAGLGTCIAIAMVYIPSFISSCLKFRTGVFPSLRDRKFTMYRVAVDLSTTLYGAAFWGCIFTGIMATVLIGGVVFFAVWHKSRSFVMNIIAQLIGITVTLLLKQVVLLVLRKQFRAAYYRKMPLKDNFMNCMLECWNIGLTSGIMLVRSANLLLVTTCYLGRLDTPLLADGVGFIGPIALDHYPISFRRDLLQHDAHRHPYIERLATMYMMKLRYGDHFASRAGSCWRLLFVLCLMPWMRKYRLREIPHLEGLELDIEEAEAELAAEEEEEEDLTKPVAPEKSLRRVMTRRRLESMRNLKSLQTVATTPASRTELLEQENTVLKERNRQLLLQVYQLGGTTASRRRPSLAGPLLQSLDQGSNESVGEGDEVSTSPPYSKPLSLVRESSQEEQDETELSYFDAKDEDETD